MPGGSRKWILVPQEPTHANTSAEDQHYNKKSETRFRSLLRLGWYRLDYGREKIAPFGRLYSDADSFGPSC